MRASGYVRVTDDWYCEDSQIVHALLQAEPTLFDGTIWDPACGRGNIPKTVVAAGGRAVASDVADRGYGLCGQDFLATYSRPELVSHIVTNPPYGIIQEFIEHALTLVPGKVCVLARLAFLEGLKRRPWFEEKPLARVWVSSRRVSMPPGGTDVKARGGTVAYAWFVFDSNHPSAEKPTLGWVA